MAEGGEGRTGSPDIQNQSDEDDDFNPEIMSDCEGEIIRELFEKAQVPIGKGRTLR